MVRRNKIMFWEEFQPLLTECSKQKTAWLCCFDQYSPLTSIYVKLMTTITSSFWTYWYNSFTTSSMSAFFDHFIYLMNPGKWIKKMPETSSRTCKQGNWRWASKFLSKIHVGVHWEALWTLHQLLLTQNFVLESM